ncbi:MAG: HEPN domain-containing protein [Deltaproteobacteria bacterium]|nr:HEPN domain-containing protein [Deltaproteobacteria bacterium]
MTLSACATCWMLPRKLLPNSIMTEKIALKWLKQALHDLDMAEKNIAIGGYDIAAFLAHQSIEKLLKAMFAIKGKKVPKTHYIDELAQELKLEAKLINDISELTIDYTFSRYPDVAEGVPYEEYTKEIAQEKVTIACGVFKALHEYYTDLLNG